jgi:hypothetical protein
MRSSGAISPSDYTFPEPYYHSFTKNQHHVSGNQLFQAPNGQKISSAGPEIAECSSDTALDPGYTPASGRAWRIRSGMGSTGVISASVCPFFWGNHHSFAQNHRPVFAKRRFLPPNGSLTPVSCPEISEYSSDTADGIPIGVQGPAYDSGLWNVLGTRSDPAHGCFYVNDQEQKTREMIHR